MIKPSCYVKCTFCLHQLISARSTSRACANVYVCVKCSIVIYYLFRVLELIYISQSFTVLFGRFLVDRCSAFVTLNPRAIVRHDSRDCSTFAIHLGRPLLSSKVSGIYSLPRRLSASDMRGANAAGVSWN